MPPAAWFRFVFEYSAEGELLKIVFLWIFHLSGSWFWFFWLHLVFFLLSVCVLQTSHWQGEVCVNYWSVCEVLHPLVSSTLMNWWRFRFNRYCYCAWDCAWDCACVKKRGILWAFCTDLSDPIWVQTRKGDDTAFSFYNSCLCCILVTLLLATWEFI